MIVFKFILEKISLKEKSTTEDTESTEKCCFISESSVHPVVLNIRRRRAASGSLHSSSIVPEPIILSSMSSPGAVQRKMRLLGMYSDQLPL